MKHRNMAMIFFAVITLIGALGITLVGSSPRGPSGPIAELIATNGLVTALQKQIAAKDRLIAEYQKQVELFRQITGIR